MPKTVDAAFSEMVDELATPRSETAAMAKHRQEIRARLEYEFGSIVRFDPIGSFGNGTNVPGYSDADYLAWIPVDSCPSRSDTLLARVRDTLKARFPSTTVEVRTPAVAVRFANDEERVEIVPARYKTTLEDEYVYEIAAGDGEWMPSSPGLHNKYVHGQHVRLSYKLKGLVRIIKYWSYLNRTNVSSFYLEMRTTKRMEIEPAVIPRYDFRYVLRHLKEVELRAMIDPTVLSGKIFSCHESYRSGALGKIGADLDRADAAFALEQAGEVEKAFALWSTVFCGSFPKYG